MGCECCRDCPCESPAIAVKHWQGPQVDRLSIKPHSRHVAQRIKIRTAMMINTALGISSRSRCIEQRQGLPFVFWLVAQKFRARVADKRLVVRFADKLATIAFGIINIDNQQWPG